MNNSQPTTHVNTNLLEILICSCILEETLHEVMRPSLVISERLSIIWFLIG